MLFHPLKNVSDLPEKMNNPFCYEPHPLCLVAADEVRRYVSEKNEWQEELHDGKMFGVLIVERGYKDVGYLAAYSGQIDGRSDWNWFVPAVFDYLQEDGYFKRNEAEITAMNHEISILEQSEELGKAHKELEDLKDEAEKAVLCHQKLMAEAKTRRDLRRADPMLTESDREELIRESQFLKAELRRIKKAYAKEINVKEEKLRLMTQRISDMKALRHKRSDALQRWLFSKFEMLNGHGERRNLLDIFSQTAFHIPPAGAGECCEPKLLQYAFGHSMRPLAIAMFWIGGSPQGEVRHEGHFYPACSGKCKPILTWMLGLDEEETIVYRDAKDMEVMYEDSDLIVVNKPSGMLSVPGKAGGVSVLDAVCTRCPDAEGPMVVHRLDMDTSGLIVVAKNKHTHKNLQRQFAMHTIRKRYIALLERPLKSLCGTIDLPLSPDITDRPRQKADYEKGKPAVTRYEVISTPQTEAQRVFAKCGHNLVALYPETGRTHQLRVHCSHHLGLDNPIVGDRLYGCKADRLYLHAESLAFTHPVTGQRLEFVAPVRPSHSYVSPKES